MTPVTPRASSSPARRHPPSLIVLIAIFGTAGVFHFLKPQPFIGIVPAWLPWPAALVAISGVAELAGALGLAYGRTRRIAAIGLIALLVAVFPANVQMLVNAHARGAVWWWLLALWIRLPVQPLLIWLTWRLSRQTRNIRPDRGV